MLSTPSSPLSVSPSPTHTDLPWSPGFTVQPDIDQFCYVAGSFTLGKFGRRFGLDLEQLLLCLWFLSFRLEKNSWQVETIIQYKQVILKKKKRLVRFLGYQMAIIKENINWFQQKGHREAEKRHFLLNADRFQNLVQRVGTLGAVEAEMSEGIWLSLVCLLLFSVGSWAIPAALQPDYMLLLGIMLCHLAEKSVQTCQLSSVKSKAHFSLSSSRLYTSQFPKLLCVAYSLH